MGKPSDGGGGTPITGGASWANVVKRNGNISAGERRTVITEPVPLLTGQQNVSTGIEQPPQAPQRGAGAVGDNRTRNG